MVDAKFLRAASAGKDVSTEGGASGYFSRPEAGLDPNLFDGMQMKPEVRTHVVNGLCTGLRASYAVELGWLHVWVAGSGVTYQWAAARGNGDLDVLFSIDLAPFVRANPQWAGANEAELAAGINAQLKKDLWPEESDVRFGDREYEVTYFFNPGTGHDIRAIHPYAAYDVLADTFSVPPPQLPDDPRSLYPSSWYDQVGHDANAAQALTAAYKTNLDRLNQHAEGTIEHHAAGATLNLTVSQATALLMDIHGGRRAAFGPQGSGYGDFANFRWQSAKESGAIKALWAMANVGTEARKAEETELYGQPIDSAEVVLRRAAGQYRDRS